MSHIFMVIDPCAKYGKPCQIKKSYWLDTKTCKKKNKNPQTFEFDLEVKVQGRISIRNVRDTSSHGVTHMIVSNMV